MKRHVPVHGEGALVLPRQQTGMAGGGGNSKVNIRRKGHGDGGVTVDGSEQASRIAGGGVQLILLAGDKAPGQIQLAAAGTGHPGGHKTRRAIRVDDALINGSLPGAVRGLSGKAEAADIQLGAVRLDGDGIAEGKCPVLLGNQLFPGGIGLNGTLGGDVLTSNTRALSEKVLDRLGMLEYMENVYSADELKMSKREVDIYEYVLKDLNTTAESAIVFEDSMYAINTARSLNIECIGLVNPNNQKVFEKNHVKTIVDFTELC